MTGYAFAPGDRFGMLEVTGPKEKRPGHTEYLHPCRCDCGQRCYAAPAYLGNGSQTSCGCHGVSARRAKMMGVRKGRLVVVDPDVASQNPLKPGEWWVRCQCDCGREHITRAHSIRHGDTSSCGCGSNKGPNHRDLSAVGDRAGMLEIVALDVAPPQGATTFRYRWVRCRCDCGGEKTVRAGVFRHGQHTSCGCMQKAKIGGAVTGPFVATEMAGERIGRLRIIEKVVPLEPRGPARPAYWRCACDCGNTAVIRAKDLRRGNTKSCGCLAHRPQNPSYGAGWVCEAGRDATFRAWPMTHALS